MVIKQAGFFAVLPVLAGGVFLFACSTPQDSRPASVEVASSSNGAITTDPRIRQILQQSCYTCHSATGSAPWYAAVAPAYLAAGSARRALDFSEWSTYDTHRQQSEFKNIALSVKNGSMPPTNYTALDHTARLSDDDEQTLLAWLEARTSAAAQ